MKSLLRSVVTVAAILVAVPASATTVLQMNLALMLEHSDRVFVGRVIDISEKKVFTAGAELPATVYKLRVSDAFKGQYQEVKGIKFTEITMIGSMKMALAGRHGIAGFPVLKIGEEYLLLMAPNNDKGLTSTVGLGQGCFHLTGREDARVALNTTNNVGLFKNMSTGMADGIAVPYADLARVIQQLVGGAQ